MRFVTFTEAGRTRAGVLDRSGTRVADLSHPAYRSALGAAKADVLGLLEAGLDDLAARIGEVAPPAAAQRNLADIRLEAPIQRPGRVIGVAHNYRCALAEREMPHPSAPVLFEKEPSTIVGPGATVLLPAGLGGCTYEAELAVIIGREAADVPAVRALDYVAGYSIFNDVSASVVIRADGDFKRGKNFPTFGPFGPYLATADEIPDAGALAVSFEMDGATLQSGSTAELLFGVEELISILSRDRALKPGDVIATGTPAGVAPLQSPPTWIRPGSIMTARVEGLGELVNPVEDSPL